VLTFTGKRTVFMNRFFPSLTDKLVRNFFFKNGELVK
ncbi:MAG: short-chain dehydrogenase, partial [Chitinophagaceae bacterium]